MPADPATAETLASAKAYLGAGLSVIPVRADGTKAPVHPGWRQYAERPPTPHELWEWWGPDAPARHGIGIPGGPASGNLAVLDFETEGAYARWLAAIPGDTHDFLDDSPLVRAPRGGAHLYCRLPEPFAGLVLARVPDPETGRPRTLVEVRGNGHQVVAPGGPLSVHPTGRPYRWERKGWLDGGTAPVVGWTVWVDWLQCAADLNEYTAPKPERPAPRERPHEPSDDDPGRDFNRRATWEDTGLFDAGWTWSREFEHDRGTVTRPGKARGTSGTLGLVSSRANDWPLFHCFTSSAVVFEQGKSYDRFGVLVRLRHGGDFAKAARSLLDRGYGRRRAVSPNRPVVSGTGPVVPPGEPEPAPAGGPVPPPADSTGQRPKSRFKFESLRELFARDSRPTWLIDRMLARRQPFVVGAPLKTLKTSVLLDMAVSLATGTPFLGRFTVPNRVRVAVVSGESGEFTIKETLARIAAARGIPDLPAAADGWLTVEFSLPTLTDAVTMSDFAGHLARLEVDVVVIDPLYLCLGDADAKNMFEMGEALAGVATWLYAARPDLTVGMVHHANKSVVAGEPMELENIAYPALAQWARQFVLLSRRTPYQNDGNHDLWFRFGGSIGTGGLHALRVAEGLIRSDFTGRFWDVQVLGLDDAAGAAVVERKRDQRARKQAEDAEDIKNLLQTIDSQVNERGRAGCHLTLLATGMGVGKARATELVTRLVDEGVIEEVQVPSSIGSGATRLVKGYRRTPD
jgi:hypothetical protein